MKKEDIIKTPSMPAFSPSYPLGPYYFKKPRVSDRHL